MKNNKNITLLLLCCYGLTTACHNISTRKEVYPNYTNLFIPETPYIPRFKKTKNEKQYGGITFYFQDTTGGVVHTHIGGSNPSPYCNVVYDQVKYKHVAISKIAARTVKDIDQRIRLCGIVADRTDLFNAPFTERGSYGYFGSKLTPKKYQQVCAKLNKRYAEVTGQAIDYVPPLASRPMLYNKALYCRNKDLARQAFHKNQIKKARFHFAAMSKFYRMFRM